VLLEREEIRRNPGSAGDVFRALDVLPGVVSTGEFSSFAVRGSWSASATYSYPRARRDDTLGEGEFAAGGIGRMHPVSSAPRSRAISMRRCP
jgi:hypothetical protein